MLVVLVRRHRRAVGVAVRRAVDNEVPGVWSRRTRAQPPGLLGELPVLQPVYALGALGIAVVERDFLKKAGM